MNNRTLILTDLSEVLISGVYGIGDRIAERYLPKYTEQYGEAEGKKRTKEIAQWVWDQVQSAEDEFSELMRGKITEDEFWDYALEENDDVIKEVKAAFEENLKRTIPGTLKLYQRIVRFPVSLRPGCTEFIDGMPEIVLLSDHIHERIHELKANHPDVFKVIKRELWSCSLGKTKRDRGCFGKVLHILDHDPNAILFVDDNRRNVLAAESRGLHGIVFKNAAQLESVMRDAYHFVFAPETP